MDKGVTESVVVIGAGGHARELYAYFQDLAGSGWRGNLLGFIDDSLAPGKYGSLQVLGSIESLAELNGGDFTYITALGNNPTRRSVVERLQSVAPRARAWSLIHPLSYLGDHVEIGDGTCLAPGSMVTARATIGRHAILNVKASVSHDCVVGDFANINPGATVCGTVKIGEGAYIGAGAVVKEKISVGAWTVVGAGAVVVQDLPANVTAAGVPARIIKQHELIRQSAR